LLLQAGIFRIESLAPMRFFCRNLRSQLVRFEDFMSSSLSRFASVACVALVLAGCAVKKSAPALDVQKEPPPPTPVACVPVQSGSPLIGTWYSAFTPHGMAGNLQTLTVLSADGKMQYESQLKIGKRVRPALSETGCWTYADGVYTMQTTASKGDPVDVTDPIYTNRYKVESVNQAKAVLREMKPGGQQITASRMSPNYRLP
jgi:hypothetical protein